MNFTTTPNPLNDSILANIQDALYVDGEPGYDMCSLVVSVSDALHLDPTLSLVQALKGLKRLDRAVAKLRNDAVWALEND